MFSTRRRSEIPPCPPCGSVSGSARRGQVGHDVGDRERALEHCGHRVAIVSGASFAGLSTAFWMSRLGYEVTVVEIAPELGDPPSYDELETGTRPTSSSLSRARRTFRTTAAIRSSNEGSSRSSSSGRASAPSSMRCKRKRCGLGSRRSSDDQRGHSHKECANGLLLPDHVGLGQDAPLRPSPVPRSRRGAMVKAGPVRVPAIGS